MIQFRIIQVLKYDSTIEEIFWLLELKNHESIFIKHANI